MSELGLHEGCYVELRDGRIKGPLRLVVNLRYPWQLADAKHDDESWSADGRTYFDSDPDQSDIVRVVSPEAVKLAKNSEYGTMGTRVVAANVLHAAMEAGIKARPAYEQFVSAIVLAAFAEAEKQIDEPVTGPLTRNEIHRAALKALDASFIMPSWREYTAKNFVEAVMQDLRLDEAENESAPGSSAVQKTEGGQSGSKIVEGLEEAVEFAKADREASMQFRPIDRLHPATRAFLETIYPDAPLRAVEFGEGFMTAGYGRPMKPAATITVGVSLPAKIPMWIDEPVTLQTCSDEILHQLYTTEQITDGQYQEERARRKMESAATSDDHPNLGV